MRISVFPFYVFYYVFWPSSDMNSWNILFWRFTDRASQYIYLSN